MGTQVRKYETLKSEVKEPLIGGIAFLLLGIGVYMFFLILDPTFLVYWNGVPMNKEIASVLCFIIAALFFLSVYYAIKQAPKSVIVYDDRIQVNKSVYLLEDIRDCQNYMDTTYVVKFFYNGKKVVYCFKSFSDEACQDVKGFFSKK